MCTFHPENFTGWGSEGIQGLIPESTWGSLNCNIPNTLGREKKTSFGDEFDLLKNVVCNHQRELIGMGKT